MAELLNISLTFSCRTSFSNKEGKSPIILRITFRSERREVFTGLYCFKQDWDPTSKRVSGLEKSAKTINKNLDMIRQSAINSFDEMKFSRDAFTIDELVDKMKGREASPTLLIDFLKEGNKKMLKRVGTEIVKPTYNKYNRSLLYMQEFLETEFKVKNYSLQKLNPEFLEKYFQFLRANKNICHNTACKYLDCIRAIILPAVNDGIIRPNPFFRLKIRPKQVNRQCLSQDEIDKITYVELLDPDLNRKRDIFLFACYTGLAYVDLQQLSSSHLIKDAENSWYIRKPRQKTGTDSIIPLLPAAVRILEKYTSTENIADFAWYISTNQKMNLGLKHIGKKAGIEKKLHMHLARHTFATTVTLANGVPIETVSKMLGHASIKQTQHYAKVVPLKIKLDMDKIRDLYK